MQSENISETLAASPVYAGFWRRFGAYWIDCLCLLPVVGISIYFSERYRLFQLYWFIPGLLIGLWFHVYLVAKYGGTPGKLLLKTRIQMLSGESVTQKAAMLRYSVLFGLSILSSIAMNISVFNMSDEVYFSLEFLKRSEKMIEMAPFWYKPVSTATEIWVWSEFIIMMLNKKRRALHDFIAGTVVVRSQL